MGSTRTVPLTGSRCLRITCLILKRIMKTYDHSLSQGGYLLSSCTYEKLEKLDHFLIDGLDLI